jgi:hypothetical protein
MTAEVARPFARPRPAAHPATAAAGGLATPWLLVPGTAAVLFAACLYLLISPGKTYTAIFANDVMVFFDGAHRVLDGQVPNRDFHTPLGPLAYWLPAFGLWAGGALGQMMPLATAAFAVVFAPVLAHVAGSRLPAPAALLFIAYAVLLVVAPVNPGDAWVSVSFAMFYNRFGWAALSVLFLLALPPRRPGRLQAVLDPLCAGAIVIGLFYLKISFAAVALLFVLGLLALSHARRTAVIALVLAMVTGLVVEVLWGGTLGYFRDIASAGAASGAVRGGLYKLFMAGVDNLRQEAAYGALLVLGLCRGVRPVYLAASLIMALCGLLLLNQSAQTTEIVTLVPAGLLAVLGPVSAHGGDRSFGVRVASVLMLLALCVPAMAQTTLALRNFYQHATAPKSRKVDRAELDGLLTLESVVPLEAPLPRDRRTTAAALRAVYRTGVADAATLNLVRHARTWQPLSQSEYLRTLKDGAALIRSDPRLSGPVFSLDISTPFNALLDRPAPRGGNSWNHYLRTFDEHVYLPPETALADVQVVLEPKDPIELYSAQYLKALYGPYVRKHFELVAQSDYWRAYRRIQ